MSQDDRISGALRDEQFAFLDKRGSCRCSGLTPVKSTSNTLQEIISLQTNANDREKIDNNFSMETIDNVDNTNMDSHRHNVDFERFGIVRSSVIDAQSVMSHVGGKLSTRNSKKTCNDALNDDVVENHDDEDANDDDVVTSTENTLKTSISTLPTITRQSCGSLDRSRISGDNNDQSTMDRSMIDPTNQDSAVTTIETTTTTRNDERSSTAASTVSFANSCSSNDANNSRLHGRNDANEQMHRNSSSDVHRQMNIANGFNGNRGNLRSMRDCGRTNVEGNVGGNVDDDDRAIDNRNNGSVNYSPTGFHNLGERIIMQPIHRGTGVNAKGNFETMQLTTDDTMEKGKCQCHHIQQHQLQQRLPNIQQREQIHPHHHHQHRHKTMQTQQQQQQQHQQQQLQQQQQQQQHPQRSHQTAQHLYRHHHYHHPHQHLGQQQSDIQRQTADQIVPRNKRGGIGPDDECDDMIETSLGTHQPPALPPRPPPRPNRRYEHNNIANYDLGPDSGDDGGCCKKYVILCCLCGGLSAAVGSLFLAVHAVLSAHTASLALFETVPSYIPGTMLILMGIFTILLARRKHRYGFLMKLCGSVGVVCALVCVLVTVTTTVVHMSRLQGLQKCIYTKLARSCTCYYGSSQGQTTDPGVLFEETPHCEAVHGALHSCLRALFGVSVAGILACIFSCMLLYQLLSHEKKKMYWEQLQLRCRSLYGQGGSGAVGGTAGGSCGCCNDCGGASPWWAQTPGNLYTPNPDLAPFSRRWRLPWSRSRGPAPTPDSNYGFHGQSRGAVMMRGSGSSGEIGENAPGPYSVLAEDTHQGGPYSLLNSTVTAPYAACASSVASYSLLENGTVPALWGPPPPYSDPNSPARRPQLTDTMRYPASNRSHTPTASPGNPVNVSYNRIVNKRIADNFDNGMNDDYRQQRGTPKRPSDNYENAEEVLSSGTDQELEVGTLHQHHQHHHHPLHPQDDESAKARRLRKSLKGVENGGFQQETNNPMSKQSESELYFGDVSSCCGPESSFYDLAVEKEQQSVPVSPDENTMEYPTPSRQTKHQRQPSKRSRMPLPLPSVNSESPISSTIENYANPQTDVIDDNNPRTVTTRGPYLAPDAQYEIIAQQTRYTYYNSKNGEHVMEIPSPSLGSLAYRNTTGQIDDEDAATLIGDRQNDGSRLTEQLTNDGTPTITTMTLDSSSSLTQSSSSPSTTFDQSLILNQRSTNDSNANTWQNDQPRSQTSTDACPVNV